MDVLVSENATISDETIDHFGNGTLHNDSNGIFYENSSYEPSSYLRIATYLLKYVPPIIILM